MVSVQFIAYTCENKFGLKFHSRNYCECANILTTSFYGEIKEVPLHVEEFLTINDKQFAKE